MDKLQKKIFNSRFLNKIIQYNKNIINFLNNACLPVFLVIYFLLFHYANNVEFVSLSKVLNVFLLLAGVSLIIYILLFGVLLGNSNKASLGASVFLIFFLIYGSLFDWLFKIDLITIKHYSLIPLTVVVSVILILFIVSLSPIKIKNIVKIIFLVVTILIIYNLIRIIPTEIQKANLAKIDSQLETDNQGSKENSEKYPDIYFIILDEAAGFDVVRDYFSYDQVNLFVDFLKEREFYVAENSRAEHPSTLYQLASIFNYNFLPYPLDNLDYYQAISNNKVVSYLRTKGYKIVILNEMRSELAYPTMTMIDADVSLSVEGNHEIEAALFYNEFVKMVTRKTMLRPIVDQMETPKMVHKNHANTIYYAMEKIGKIEEVNSPKFVYFHLLIPHVPFMFNHLGFINDQHAFYDWNYYLENYRFSLHVAETMIKSIFNASDPDLPPIIILQSDHGARNMPSTDPYHHPLENYPEEYANHIINAIHLPYCDNKNMSQDMNPINTFPMIFNCIFDDNIVIK